MAKFLISSAVRFELNFLLRSGDKGTLMNVWSVNIYVGYVSEWGTNSRRVYVRVAGQAVEVREEEEEEES